ncbi:hypothetical protein V6N11_025727 [Hibiscus sabdariffa]|uniref:RRM domain-containing protein n=1 Tax=Hibiscus sabdariffa TaxID=183260 RepID=A0ABR2STG9_9ROSI
MAYPRYRSPFGDTTFTKVFVGGLPWEAPTEGMRRYFEQFGEILEAVIITDKITGKSKGYGFVTFRDPDSARRACVDPNPVIYGRRANCNIASFGKPSPLQPRGRNQDNSPYQGAVQQGGGVAAPVPPPLLPPPVIYPPPYGYPTYSPEYGFQQVSHDQPLLFSIKQIVEILGIDLLYSRLSIINNTITNYMDHHLPQWGLHIIMDILCKLQGEHFLHPKLNVSPDRPFFTILLNCRGPSQLILPHPFTSLHISVPLQQAVGFQNLQCPQSNADVLGLNIEAGQKRAPVSQ